MKKVYEDFLELLEKECGIKFDKNEIFGEEDGDGNSVIIPIMDYEFGLGLCQKNDRIETVELLMIEGEDDPLLCVKMAARIERVIDIPIKIYPL